MAIIKYLAISFLGSASIEQINVLRETELCVFLQEGRKERRVNKIGYRESYFSSWEEAHAFLLDKANERLLSARRELERAQGNYGNIKGMKKPTEGQ